MLRGAIRQNRVYLHVGAETVRVGRDGMACEGAECGGN
jgi:hypothetical protein